MKIFITGARAPIALELCRSFKLKGHTVILADTQKFSIARWSNTVDAYYTLPSPRFNKQAFIKTLQEIIKEEQIDHLIPTCEEAIHIANCKELLPCKVWTAEGNLTLDLHNKFTFYKKFKHLLPIPETKLLTEFDKWSESSAYVFKAVYSRFASAVILNKQLSPTAFEKEGLEKWVAQKHVKGKEVCVYSIWDNGKLKSMAQYHPLYRAGKGAGVFFEPIQHTEVYNYVKKFGETICYTGQLSFDIIIDKEHTPYFIECNPRGTSGAHLLNTKLADLFLGEEEISPTPAEEFCIKYAMILLHPWSFLTRRVWQSKDIVFSLSDPKPFLLQFLTLIEITFIKLSKKISWLEATTSDIEWNGN